MIEIIADTFTLVVALAVQIDLATKKVISMSFEAFEPDLGQSFSGSSVIAL